MQKFVSKHSGYDGRYDFHYGLHDFFTVTGGDSTSVRMIHDKTNTVFFETVKNLETDYIEVFRKPRMKPRSDSMNYGDYFKSLNNGTYNYGKVVHFVGDLSQFIGSNNSDYVFKHLPSGHQYVVSEDEVRNDYLPASEREILVHEINEAVVNTDDISKLQAIKAMVSKPAPTDKERIAELERQMELQIEISKETVGLLRDMTDDFNRKLRLVSLRQ